MESEKLQLFEDQQIRSAWDAENEEWLFSVVNVVQALTDQPDYDTARKYWNKLKERMGKEGAQLVTTCHQLRLKSPKDGKRYKTDVATTRQLLRIIQSIPSPKAEPFKLWLAQVGAERIEETIDPELTDEWQAHGVTEGREYAILTDELTKAWSGMNTRQYKSLKGLKKENLRDNMSTLELALNLLAEATTAELTRVEDPMGLEENKAVSRRGGTVAGNARREIEAQTGRPVITAQNAAQLNAVVTKLITDGGEVTPQKQDNGKPEGSN